MSDEIESFEVPESLAGERVDRAVALLTGFSRADVQTLMAEGKVTVDDASVAKSRRLRAGEVLSVTGRPAPPEVPGPEPVEFDVAHEDADLVVVVKPAGLVVHPGAGNEHGTLVHGLLEKYPEIAEVGDSMRPGIVHRLDRDTSGLMLVARSPRAHRTLVEMLATRQVERRYQALVWGVPEPARGSVEAPIGRSRRNPTRIAVTPSGREARTHYEVRISGRLPCWTWPSTPAAPTRCEFTSKPSATRSSAIPCTGGRERVWTSTDPSCTPIASVATIP